MPKVLALQGTPDGRIGVTLDMPAGDPGSVTIYTDAELEAVISAAVLAEREACADIADIYKDDYSVAASIASAIRARNP